MPSGTRPVDEYRKTLDSIDKMRDKLTNMGISSLDQDDKIYIIHIDDKYGNLIITKKLLEDLDHAFQVHTFQSPSDALNNIDTTTDIVITNLNMQEMDGITLAQTIKQTHDIPVVIYTGALFKDYVKEALDAGVDEFCKIELDPYHLWVLANRIRRTVNKNKIRKADTLVSRSP